MQTAEVLHIFWNMQDVRVKGMAEVFKGFKFINKIIIYFLKGWAI